MTFTRAWAAASCMGLAGIQVASALQLDRIIVVVWPWSLTYLPFAAVTVVVGYRLLRGDG